MFLKYWSSIIGAIVFLAAIWMFTYIGSPTYIYNTFYTSDSIAVAGPAPADRCTPTPANKELCPPPPANGVSDVEKNDQGRIR